MICIYAIFFITDHAIRFYYEINFTKYHSQVNISTETLVTIYNQDLHQLNHNGAIGPRIHEDLLNKLSTFNT